MKRAGTTHIQGRRVSLVSEAVTVPAVLQYLAACNRPCLELKKSPDTAPADIRYRRYAAVPPLARKASAVVRLLTKVETRAAVASQRCDRVMIAGFDFCQRRHNRRWLFCPMRGRLHIDDIECRAGAVSGDFFELQAGTVAVRRDICKTAGTADSLAHQGEPGALKYALYCSASWRRTLAAHR